MSEGTGGPGDGKALRCRDENVLMMGRGLPRWGVAANQTPGDVWRLQGQDRVSYHRSASRLCRSPHVVAREREPCLSGFLDVEWRGSHERSTVAGHYSTGRLWTHDAKATHDDRLGQLGDLRRSAVSPSRERCPLDCRCPILTEYRQNCGAPERPSSWPQEEGAANRRRRSQAESPIKRAISSSTMLSSSFVKSGAGGCICWPGGNLSGVQLPTIPSESYRST